MLVQKELKLKKGQKMSGILEILECKLIKKYKEKEDQQTEMSPLALYDIKIITIHTIE
jgi:hypothetical protein